MKRIFLSTILAVSAFTASADEIVDAYLGGNEPILNEQEKAAVELAKQWRSSDKSPKPIVGDDGSVKYYFGQSQPVMVCAPLEVCVIQLEPGEVITALQSGDVVRWQITPTVVGTNDGEKQSQVVVKPTDVGLLSSLYIGTDRRSYHIKLKSSRTEFIPKMSFAYPANFNQTWEKYQKAVAEKNERHTLPASAPGDTNTKRIDQLDFKYEIYGKARWRPERVYNDGVRTIIQMPENLSQSEAPVLLVVDAHGDEKMVNSRLKGRSFIVDQVFDKAVLISGVGKKQTRITVERI